MLTCNGLVKLEMQILLAYSEFQRRTQSPQTLDEFALFCLRVAATADAESVLKDMGADTTDEEMLTDIAEQQVKCWRVEERITEALEERLTERLWSKTLPRATEAMNGGK